MKILIDMNLSPLWVEFFKRHSLSSVHWSEVGPRDASDRSILDYAATHGFIVFTHDLDFGTMLARSAANAPSVIQVRAQDVLPSVLGESIVAAISLTADQLATGAPVTVDPRQHRVRILPIRS